MIDVETHLWQKSYLGTLFCDGFILFSLPELSPNDCSSNHTAVRINLTISSPVLMCQLNRKHYNSNSAYYGEWICIAMVFFMNPVHTAMVCKSEIPDRKGISLGR